MDRLGLTPGHRVADIGAGEGYYIVRLARPPRPVIDHLRHRRDAGVAEPLNQLE